MNQIEALTGMLNLTNDLPKFAELFPPDKNEGDWVLCYDTRIMVRWEAGFYKISLLHGRDEVTLGYYTISDCLIVLKSATL